MIYGRAGAAEKKFSINFSKAKTKNGLSLHPNYDNSYLFVNGAEIYNPIQEEQKAPPPPSPTTSFSPVTSTNVGFSTANFLTFSFNPFSRLA